MKTTYSGKLAIVTSFYSHYAYAPYVISLAHTLGVLSKLEIDWDYVARPSDFHVERALNNTLTELMERGDFTDILLIDSDESWEPEAVIRLLFHPDEIVGASYRMKNNWNTYVGTVEFKDGAPVGRMLADGTALLSSNRVSAGFMRIKVSALRKFADHYKELRSIEPDGEKVIFFERPTIEGITHCQDMAFSRRWIEMGGKLWIDPMAHVDHWGMECHVGNLDKFLRDNKARKENEGKEKTAFAIVQQMAEELKQRAA